MFINRKSMIAAATLIACAAPMLAHAQSNIKIYGRLFPEINSWSVSGGTASTQPVGARSSLSASPTSPASISGLSMQASNSKLGFSGTEDLGGGMKAVFQLEMVVAVDDGTIGSSLWSQDTYVGLEGGFGSLKFGRIDTVYKKLGDKLSWFGVSSGNFISGSNILTKRGFGTGNEHRFHERLPNTIYYVSPAFNSISADFSYALGEVAGNTKSRSVMAGGVKYDKGPIYMALAHEVHYDYFGSSRNLPTSMSNTIGGTGSARTGTPTPGASSTDSSTRASFQYRFSSDTRAEVDYAVTTLEETGGTVGRFASHTHNSWLFNVQHKVSPALTLQGAIGGADEGSCSRVGGTACSTAGLDSQLFHLAAYYALSKRTGLFALYGQIKNGANANRTSLNSSNARVVNGQTTTQVALGIDHSF